MNWLPLKNNRKHIAYIVLLLFIVTLFLKNSLFNQWLNWDDTVYVLENYLVRSLSWQNIKDIFTTPQINGSYNPLVVVTWAFDYALGTYNPVYYHTTNLILHLGCVLLVYAFVFKVYQKHLIAFLIALFFGIHPMHISTVAWVSSRKELLYTFFLLIGMIGYLMYVQQQNQLKKQSLFICFVAFVCACLSKGSAIVFPIILILLDCIYRRTDMKKVLVEKIPFLLISVLFFYVGVKGQNDSGALEYVAKVPWYDSIFVASYGYVIYVIKAVVPFQLAVFHPYPVSLGAPIPWYFYICIVPVLGCVFYLVKFYKKERLLCFGLAFYLVTLLLVIQLIPFGSAIICERFTYLPYLGLFIVFAELLRKIEVLKRFQNIGIILVLGVVVVYGVVNDSYVKTFKNTESIWTNVIKLYPNDYKGYMNRTSYKTKNKDWKGALADTQKAMKLNPIKDIIYYNRGFIYENTGKIDWAIRDYTKAIALSDNTLESAFLNRGILYFQLDQYQKALKDFDMCIELEPKASEAYFNKGLVCKKIKNYKDAILNFSKAIERGNNYRFYINRAAIFSLLGQKKKAIEDYSNALQINKYLEDVYLKRGELLIDVRQLPFAIQNNYELLKVYPNNVKAYINLGFIYLNTQAYGKALGSLNKAILLNPKSYLAYYNRGLLFKTLGEYQNSLKDFEKAYVLNPNFKVVKKEQDEVLKLLYKKQNKQ